MKYMGSKAKIAKEILPIILKDKTVKQWYIEPFAGGMNMIDKVGGLRWANDCNEYLIAMWAALVNDEYKPGKITKGFYETVKTFKPIYPKHVVGWVGFNCSYSGKFFGGFAGDTLTKEGAIRDYQTEAIKNVLRQVQSLKGVYFTSMDYAAMNIKPASIIYCDIPYKNTTVYSKTNFNYEHFYNWILEQHEVLNCTVFISEYEMPEPFKCVWSKEVTSSLSANGKYGGNKKSIEKLFTL